MSSSNSENSSEETLKNFIKQSTEQAQPKSQPQSQLILRKVDPPIFPNLNQKKNFIRRSYENIFLFHEIFKYNKDKVYDPMFFWSNSESSIKNIEGKFIELELNFKVPDDAETFSLPRERQILYCRYFMKEMIMHSHYAMDYYYNISPEYKKYLLVKESKKYFVDPMIIILGLALIKKIVHIIRFRQFVKKSFLPPFFGYIGICTLTGVHHYMEYVAHFTFMAKEVLQQRGSVPIEQEYQEYLIYKNQLYLYERDRVIKTETTHPTYIRDDLDLVLKSIKPKPIF